MTDMITRSSGYTCTASQWKDYVDTIQCDSEIRHLFGNIFGDFVLYIVETFGRHFGPTVYSVARERCLGAAWWRPLPTTELGTIETSFPVEGKVVTGCFSDSCRSKSSMAED